MQGKDWTSCARQQAEPEPEIELKNLIDGKKLLNRTGLHQLEFSQTEHTIF
jgi:hypothetical protein